MPSIHLNVPSSPTFYSFTHGPILRKRNPGRCQPFDKEVSTFTPYQRFPTWSSSIAPEVDLSKDVEKSCFAMRTLCSCSPPKSSLLPSNIDTDLFPPLFMVPDPSATGPQWLAVLCSCHEASREEHWRETSVALSLACCLQSTPIPGYPLKRSGERRYPRTCTMPSSTSCRQYTASLLPSTLELVNLLQPS